MPDIPCWTVGFTGQGDVTHANASELLDNWMPEDAEILALIPGRIPRSHKGLATVKTLLLSEFDVPIETVDTSEMITVLQKASDADEHTVLVVLGVDDEATLNLASDALDAGIPVKDLCAALDVVEFAKEEEGVPVTVTPGRRRSSNRNSPSATGIVEAEVEVVEAEVDGPAHIVRPSDMAAAKMLEQAIRTIIKEELAMFPGVHASTEIPGEAIDDKNLADTMILAYADADGNYRRATKRTRKRAGETEVELTEAEARVAGLL